MTAPGRPARPATTGRWLHLTGAIVGGGFLASLAVGLLVGWLIGDLALGVGRTVTWGTTLAAVVAVVVVTTRSGDRGRGRT